MTLDASAPLVAVSVLAWVMIVLPVVLLLIVAVMYIVRGRPTTEEIERAQRASETDTPGPGGPERRVPRG
jgi:flagellar basal body-associated protein FliL